MRFTTHVIFFILCIVWFQNIFAANEYSVAALPVWIKPAPNVTSDPSHLNNIPSGYYFLKVEEQINLADNTFFCRNRVKIISQSGVQQASTVSIDFNPSYQKLIVHHIKVISTDATEVDMLKKIKPNIIQRESNFEAYQYDGIKTALFILSNVKEGDVIEYAYSLKGTNPVFKNKFSRALYFQTYVPVTCFHYRLICPSNRKLQLKNFSDAPAPVIAKEGGNTVYEWTAANKQAYEFEDYTPAWFSSMPQYQISEYDSWKEVAQWALDVFAQKSNASSPSLDAVCSKIFSKSKSKEDSIWAAIHYVQDDVRYMGIEVGVNSHKPNPPEKVISQGYGDCKDKSLLLVHLLKKVGVDAYPALVSTFYKNELDLHLPSPLSFNHVIVVFSFNASEYRVDPTITNQNGKLYLIYCPDYGSALILSPQTDNLKYFKSCYPGWIKITERYKLAANEDSAFLEVYTRYTGREAEIVRASMNTIGGYQFRKNALDFYTKLYPDIIDLEKFRFEDKKSTNELTTIEKYLIPQLWERNAENNNIWTRSFYPSEVGSRIPISEIRTRKSPIAVYNHPVAVYHNIEVVSNTKWDIEPFNETISTSAFDVTIKRGVNGKVVKQYYSFVSSRDHIPVYETKEYLKTATELKNKLEYQLYWNKGLESVYAFDWKLFFVVLLFIGILIWVFIKVYSLDVLNEYSGNEPEIFGGWLLLVIFGICIKPFTFIKVFYDFNFFNNYLTQSLITKQTLNYNPALAALIVAECFANVFMLASIIFLLVLLFKKRTIFPLAFVVFVSSSIVISIADSIASKMLGVNVELFDNEMIGVIISACIWIPYMMISERVKRTFTVVSAKTREKNSNLFMNDTEQELETPD